jgi:type VI secretion system protein
MLLSPSISVSIAAVIVFLLSSCSAIPLHRVVIEASENANQNQATAIDLVLIQDSNFLSVLPKNSVEWFEKKASLLASLGQSIDVVSLQIPPASVVDVKLPKDLSKAVHVLSYANYLTSEGQMIGDLSSYKCVRIMLEAQRVSYAECR